MPLLRSHRIGAALGPDRSRQASGEHTPPHKKQNTRMRGGRLSNPLKNRVVRFVFDFVHQRHVTVAATPPRRRMWPLVLSAVHPSIPPSPWQRHAGSGAAAGVPFAVRQHHHRALPALQLVACDGQTATPAGHSGPEVRGVHSVAATCHGAASTGEATLRSC